MEWPEGEVQVKEAGPKALSLVMSKGITFKLWELSKAAICPLQNVLFPRYHDIDHNALLLIHGFYANSSFWTAEFSESVCVSGIQQN